MPEPNTLPGANSVGTMAAANSLNSGWPLRSSRNSRSGIKTGTSRANARQKSVFMVSISGSGVHKGCGGFYKRGAEMIAEYALDLARRRGDDRDLRH